MLLRTWAVVLLTKVSRARANCGVSTFPESLMFQVQRPWEYRVATLEIRLHTTDKLRKSSILRKSNVRYSTSFGTLAML